MSESLPACRWPSMIWRSLTLSYGPRFSDVPRFVRSVKGSLLVAALAVFPMAPVAYAVETAGFVVESLQPGSGGSQAGLRVGDVLVTWWREAAASGPAKRVGGELSSPFDFSEVEREEAPRGPVKIEGRRQGEPFTVELLPGRWGIEGRPWFPQDATAIYLEARKYVAADDLDSGLRLLRRLTAKLHHDGRHSHAAWLSFEVADLLLEAQRWGEARVAMQAGLADAEASGRAQILALGHEQLGAFLKSQDALKEAVVHYEHALALRQAMPANLATADMLNHLGLLAIELGNFDGALDLLERGLEISSELAPDSMMVADIRGRLAVIFGIRSDFSAAMEHMLSALEIQERLAPQSSDVVQTLSRLALASRRMGRLAEAEAYFRRALELQQRLDPDSYSMATVLNNLGVLLTKRGDLNRAEAYFWRSLELFAALRPESLAVAGNYSNLGGIFEARGNLEAAERYHRQAFDLVERLTPESPNLGFMLDSLGNLALERHDPVAAKRSFERALALRERVSPGSISVAHSWRDLGRTAAAAGQLEEAERLLRRALDIERRVAPGSLDVAHTLDRLGEVAARRQQLRLAEGYHLEALGTHRRLAPGSLAEAISCQRLASIYRRLGRDVEAGNFYALAIAALEVQNHRVGGSYEDRSEFAAARAPLYADSVDLLVEQGRFDEAFQVLERSRSRAFLEMLSQRDLSFAADVPAELLEQQRLADQRYDQVLGQLARLSAQTPEGGEEALHDELGKARRQQHEIKARIRAASPRLAALRDAEPLDLQATRQLLSPGTLMLAYSLGETGGHLFVIGHGEEQVRVFPVAIGLTALRDEVARLRKLLGSGESLDAIRFRAQRLGELLLAPARHLIADAERLLILPQGPLHILPFSALLLPTETGEWRFLIEHKPLTVVASATVFAMLRKRELSPGEIRLSAFGDPTYSAPEASASLEQPALRAALELGLRLDPLPTARAEVEALEKLFPEGTRTFLGAAATEEAAKSVAPSSNVLHFACHAVVDDRFPLESALILSLPTDPQHKGDNGLLQAWEIFEEMRLDAELVTLSACDTALGKELAGEGMIGLTRAFQYAGARSILASLWAVNDASTAGLMEQFYGQLKLGAAKDLALRQAQLTLLRNGGDFAHPFHWAAFILVGDWR